MAICKTAKVLQTSPKRANWCQTDRMREGGRGGINFRFFLSSGGVCDGITQGCHSSHRNEEAGVVITSFFLEFNHFEFLLLNFQFKNANISEKKCSLIITIFHTWRCIMNSLTPACWGNMNFCSDVVVCEYSHFGSWAPGTCQSRVWGHGTRRTIASNQLEKEKKSGWD